MFIYNVNFSTLIYKQINGGPLLDNHELQHTEIFEDSKVRNEWFKFSGPYNFALQPDGVKLRYF